MNEQTVLKAALSDGLMHAVLLSGPDRTRCDTLARRVAACFLFGKDEPERLACCPDFVLMEPPHAVDGMREMIAALGNRSFSENAGSGSGLQWDSCGRRCVLISAANTLNANCQNALLKVLEEPPEQMLFILVGNEASLLQTIRSRSSVIRLGTPSREETKNKLAAGLTDAQTAANASAWADGLESDARMFVSDGYITFRKEATAVFIDALDGNAVYHRTAALLKNDFREEADTEEPAKDKPVKTETFNAPLIIDIWQSLVRDALLTKLSPAFSSGLRCPEAAESTARIARLFTFSQLECIIEMLDSGIARLNGGASPAQTVDLMLTGLPRKEK